MLFPGIPIMTILWAKVLMAIYGHMATYGHMAIYGHNQHGLKCGHDGYPRKEHEKCSLPVKKSSDLDVLFKRYGQNKIFRFFPYVTPYVKIKVNF